MNKIWLNYWVFSVWKSVNITAVQFSSCCSSSSDSFTLPIAWKKPTTQSSPIGYLNYRTLSLPQFTSLTSIFNIFVPSTSLSLLSLRNPFLFPSQTITFIDIYMYARYLSKCKSQSGVPTVAKYIMITPVESLLLVHHCLLLCDVKEFLLLE